MPGQCLHVDVGVVQVFKVFIVAVIVFLIFNRTLRSIRDPVRLVEVILLGLLFRIEIFNSDFLQGVYGFVRS